MAAAGLGPWEPLTPPEVAALFHECPRPWWIAGGIAIDAFVGRGDRREHGDLDVGLLARDQAAVRAAVLADWDLHCADPPGSLRPWHPGETLQEPVHDVWARESADGPWRFDISLNPADGDEWAYRRDARIRMPLVDLVFRVDGIPYLVPEVQLLFKSKGLRERDERDFEDAAPLLDAGRRRWLRDALHTCSPGHQWLSRL
jgi:hypothetical protein